MMAPAWVSVGMGRGPSGMARTYTPTRLPPSSTVSRSYVAIVNQVTGRDYGWFFDAYLREAALPHLETHRSGDVLSLEWRVPGNRPFPMPVEVKVGDRMETVPMADGHGRLTILAGETTITLDPRSKILRQLDGIDRFQRWRKASSAPAAGAR